MQEDDLDKNLDSPEVNPTKQKMKHEKNWNKIVKFEDIQICFADALRHN